MQPPTKFEIMRENRSKAKRIKLLKEKKQRDLDIERMRHNSTNSIPSNFSVPAMPFAFFF